MKLGPERFPTAVGGPPNLRGKKAKNVGILPNVLEVKMAANEEVEDLGLRWFRKWQLSPWKDGTHGFSIEQA